VGQVLRAEEISDLITTTQKNLGPLRWTMIGNDLQEYIAMPSVLRKERVQFDSGYVIQRQVMTDLSNAAKQVGLFQKDVINVNDVMKTIEIPWRHSTTNYAIERREVSMNRQPAKIVDLVETRRTDAMWSLAELCENQMWSKPADSSDETEIFGVPYWLVDNATTGFNGGNPDGFTSGAGGLDSATYTRWRNYTDRYVNVSKDDLVRKMRKAYAKIKFKAPIKFPNLDGADRYAIYVNYVTLAALEEIGESQNENLGRDIASMDGQIMFRRTPIKWVPKLDSDSKNPVKFINWGVFHPVFLSGEYMREEGPMQVNDQHNTFVTHVDMTWNFFCTNRRRLANIQTA
jgi:hypothetical protein